MNATADADLVKAVQQHLIALKNDIDKLAFEKEEERQKLETALNMVTEDLKRRVSKLEEDFQLVKYDLAAAMETTQNQMGELRLQQEDTRAQVFRLKETQDTRMLRVEQEQVTLKANQYTLCEGLDTTQTQITELQLYQKDMERRVTYLGDQISSNNQIRPGTVSVSFDLSLLENNRSLHVLEFIIRADLFS